MQWSRCQWFYRWSAVQERPTLLRNPSQKVVYVYLAAFTLSVYVLYIVASPSLTTPDSEATSAAEPSVRGKHARLLLQELQQEQPEHLKQQSDFTPVKVFGSNGGVKDEAIISTVASKTILLWNTFFKQSDYIPPLTKMCPEYACEITSNRSAASDAVIVHLRDIDVADVPERTSPDQIFVLLNAEAPPYSPPIPDVFNKIFNWTITYRVDAEVPLTKSVQNLYRYDRSNQKDYKANKTKMAAWFVSHCSTSSERETLVSELSRHGIHTDIVGGCGNIKCPRDGTNDCFKEFSKHYHFYLSFENAICTDYVTEKLFNALHFGEMIPVVLGGADYSKVAPAGSYIDVSKFTSIKQLAVYLKKVADDRNLYNSYHKWRSYYQVIEPLHYACRLCAKLHTMSHRTEYQDFNAYWHTNTCKGNWKKAFKL